MSVAGRPAAAVLAVLAVEGRVLLVRRANPPDGGLWGYPGGHVERGETVFAAAERELREETGVEGRAVRLIEALDAIERAPGGAVLRHFILLAVACAWTGGDPVAGSDALEAAWFAADALRDGDAALSRHVARIARGGAVPAGPG